MLPPAAILGFVVTQNIIVQLLAYETPRLYKGVVQRLADSKLEDDR